MARAKGPTAGVFLRSNRSSQKSARWATKIDQWVEATEKRKNAVFRDATQRIIDIMQSTVPVKDGFLRASLVVAVNSPPPAADKKKGDSSNVYNPAAIQAAISKAVAGDRIVAAYTMVYARRLEFGFTGVDSLGRNYNQPARGWARLAAQQWAEVVAQSGAAAKARVAERSNGE